MRYFEVTHNVSQSDLLLTHPNEYFIESRKLLQKAGSGGTSMAGSGRVSSSATATQEGSAHVEVDAAAMEEVKHFDPCS